MVGWFAVYPAHNQEEESYDKDYEAPNIRHKRRVADVLNYVVIRSVADIADIERCFEHRCICEVERNRLSRILRFKVHDNPLIAYHVSDAVPTDVRISIDDFVTDPYVEELVIVSYGDGVSGRNIGGEFLFEYGNLRGGSRNLCREIDGSTFDSFLH